jgi:hypothetical protein
MEIEKNQARNGQEIAFLIKKMKLFFVEKRQ